MIDGELAAGTTIAGYRIESEIGRGGMGVVYLAERPQGGPCALKVLSGGPGLEVGAATRFRREARYAARLEHPHVIAQYETGETEAGTPFIAMQYVHGEDLGALLARDGVMDLAAAVALIDQVGSALDAAHAAGIVHRDVKPANIIIAREAGRPPHAYLTDFGLGKSPDEDSIALTRQGQFVGTMPYTAPEEILGAPRDHRVDVYSLGCVLYEMLVGTPPFVRERELDVLYAHIGDPRPSVHAARADLPPGIDAVLARAMAIAPDERYPSCAEFATAARALLGPGGRPPVPAAGATEDGPLRLVVAEGFGLGRELLLEGEVVLGRLSTFEGELAPDRGISRRHARLWPAPDGGFNVEDAGSANGTFLNDERLDQARPLRPGDRLRIGACVLVVVAGETEAPGDAPGPLSDPAVTAPSPDAAATEPVPDAAAGPAPAVTDPVEIGLPPSAPRVTVSLELDLEAGEIGVAIDGRAAVRIVRRDGVWRVDGP